MNSEILQMIDEYGEDKEFFGKASEETIKKAENRLGVTFPPQYREYVKNYGAGGICGVRISGIEKENHASVVEDTESYREFGLPKKYIVIENVDEFIYCLSTVEEYKVIRWDRTTKEEIKRYNTFGEYLQDMFQEAIDNW